MRAFVLSFCVFGGILALIFVLWYIRGLPFEERDEIRIWYALAPKVPGESAHDV
jgi:hypothetical protein